MLIPWRGATPTALHVTYYNDRKNKKDPEGPILNKEVTTLLLAKRHKEDERQDSHHLRVLKNSHSPLKKLWFQIER